MSEDINSQDVKDGRTRLHKAVWIRNVTKVTELLEAGADVSIQDKAGRPALFWQQWGPYPKMHPLRY